MLRESGILRRVIGMLQLRRAGFVPGMSVRILLLFVLLFRALARDCVAQRPVPPPLRRSAQSHPLGVEAQRPAEEIR